jgi:hypothetical protein
LNKLFLLFLIFGFDAPINAEQYPIHKYTCPQTGGECNAEERAVVKLVNDKYWKMLSDWGYFECRRWALWKICNCLI